MSRGSQKTSHRPQKGRKYLLAAARCWERAGFLEEAARRFSAAEAWPDAGRCYALAECHTDAALAYFRADEPMLEARQFLMAGRPERAQFIYGSLSESRMPAARVEIFLGLAKVKDAVCQANVGGRQEIGTLARLFATRGRFDLSVRIRLAATELSAKIFEHWNRSLRWHRLPTVIEATKPWPTSEFGDATLAPIWRQTTGDWWWGDGVLDWSADSEYFAAALATRGLAYGRIDGDNVRLDSWQFPEDTLCTRFLPASHTVALGHHGGVVRIVREGGSAEALNVLQLQGDVWSLAFAPQGDRIAIAARTNSGTELKVWSWREGRNEALLEEFQKPDGIGAPLAAWSPAGDRLFWSPTNSLIFLWGAEAPEPHTRPIRSLAFTADGRFLITASYDRTLVVRDGTTGKGVASPEKFASPVQGAAVHPQTTLVAVGEGKHLHLLRFHLTEAPLLSRLSVEILDHSVKSLSFSPDGHHLLVMTSSHLHLFRVHLKQ